MLGTTMAARTFEILDGGEILVEIDFPIPPKGDNVDWNCMYRIIGGGLNKTGNSYGVDGIQAIYLAMLYISNSLYGTFGLELPKVSWSGASNPGDLGLPISNEVAAARQEDGK